MAGAEGVRGWTIVGGGTAWKAAAGSPGFRSVAAGGTRGLVVACRREGAVGAGPDADVDEGALVGPPARIRERFRAWQDSGATGLTLLTGDPREMELLAKLAGARPRDGRDARP